MNEVERSSTSKGRDILVRPIHDPGPRKDRYTTT
jgi:hypothetical protein